MGNREKGSAREYKDVHYKECANCGYPLDEIERQGMTQDRNGRMLLNNYVMLPRHLLEGAIKSNNEAALCLSTAMSGLITQKDMNDR